MLFRFDAEGSVDMEVLYLPAADFRKMQLLQLDMVLELDRVCRKHDIKYVLTCGSLLGAVRHKGYIPWDDDADIGMLREEYEKFRKVAHELDPTICYFQDHENDPDYLWEYGKLRRIGTSYIRAGQEHLKGKTGVFIDIFPMDDIPKKVIGQVIQDFYCFFLRKVLWARVGKKTEKGFLKIWYVILSQIPVNWVYRRVNSMTARSKNINPNRVRILLFTSFGKLNYKHPLSERYGMPKKWFLDREEYTFEGHQLYGSRDYDGFLKYMYGDYMKLPPEEERKPAHRK